MTYEWFDVTRNAGIVRTMHMSYRAKTYIWNDVILVKRSVIRIVEYRCVLWHNLRKHCLVGYSHMTSHVNRLVLLLYSAPL